jgi:carbon starvation protein
VSGLLIVVVTFVGYVIAYHTYGRFLARKIFRLDDSAAVPSHVYADGIDFVPTRKGIIFGHHYTSIAGTGPIVGPAIGIIWGWVPALVWVFVGSIVMGAVHDFGALVISLRNEGKSLSDITARYVNARARTIFFLIVFLELLIVIAIFGVVIAAVFKRYPQAVVPIWLEVPIAIAVGLAVYRWKANVTLATIAGVVAMYITVWMGHYSWFQVEMGSLTLGGTTIPPVALWVILLLIYAYVASSIPVTVLLQPRDYLNAWQLFVAMGLMIAGAVGATVSGGLNLVAPAFDASPPGAPPIWPFLFITIACGAVSGFHCLVASGTTPKQIRKESDALFVGYGSMLLEGALAILVLVAVGAGIGLVVDGASGGGQAAWTQYYSSWGGGRGVADKVAPVVEGSAKMISTLGVPYGIGVIIMGVFIASFAGTTLDTATRIQRYVIAELASHLRIKPLANRWVATAVAVVSAGALAFGAGKTLGTGAIVLWPMFGAVNQLLAALALVVITIYLKRKTAWGWLLTGLPCLFMLAMTLWAVGVNECRFITAAKPSWALVVINGLTFILALALIVEALIVLLRPAPGQADRPAATPGE